MPILVALVVFFAGSFVYRCLYRAWARGELATLKRAARATPLYPSGRMVLRGRLRAGALTTTRRAGSSKHERVGEPWLELADGRVSFAGEVCVAHGTRFSSRWWSALPCSTRSLVDGDEVMLEGELGRTADGTRELRPTVRWNPSPSIQAHAVEGIVKPGAVGLLAAAVIVGSLGLVCYSKLRTSRIAPAQQSARVASKPRAECPVTEILQAVRLDDAVAAAERCGTREDKLWANLFAGRFEDAERHLAPSDGVQPALRIEVALGHWNEAAGRLESAIDADHAAANAPDRCVVALFRSFAGEAGAFDRLSRLELDARCQVLRALTLPRAEQAAALRGIRGDLALLARATTSAPVTRAWLESISWGGSLFEWDRAMWFMPFIAEQHPRAKAPRLGDVLHREAIGRAIVRGDLAAAHRELSAIQSLEMREIASFDLALVEGGRLDSNYRSELAAMRNDGIATRDLLFFGVIDDPCKTTLGSAALTALGGDGGPLAHALKECKVYLPSVSDWAAMLPRVHQHRAALALALRSQWDPTMVYTSVYIPFELVNKLTARRTLAALSGDSEEAQRLQVIIDRHTAPLADLHKLIAFWLLTDYESAATTRAHGR